MNVDDAAGDPMSDDRRSVPILRSRRLRLRPFAETDLDGLHAIFSDPETMRYWTTPVFRDRAQTARWVKYLARFNPDSHAAWAVDLKSDGRFVGMVNYYNREPRNRRLEVGYILARSHWRQGLMAEAMGALLDHCFKELGVHRVEATIEPENRGSIALAEGLGFRAESGPLRDRILVDGQYRSVLMYALVR